MRKKGIVIAIDGPAGAGKSTTARLAAQTLGYVYLDTGAMYRAVGLAALQAAVPLDDGNAVSALAKGLAIDLIMVGGAQHTLVNGQDVSPSLRTPEVSLAASNVAVHQGVRDVLVAKQQAIGRDGGIVLEGRDTGTAIFPDAELKVFLVADVEERARRRQREMKGRGECMGLDLLAAQIRERDERDAMTQRRFGPWPPLDAVLVDTTGLSVSEQVRQVVDLARMRGV